jgi:hypothetical protein
MTARECGEEPPTKKGKEEEEEEEEEGGRRMGTGANGERRLEAKERRRTKDGKVKQQE